MIKAAQDGGSHHAKTGRWTEQVLRRDKKRREERKERQGKGDEEGECVGEEKLT